MDRRVSASDTYDGAQQQGTAATHKRVIALDKHVMAEIIRKKGCGRRVDASSWVGPSHGLAQDCGHGLCFVPHSYLFDSSCHPLGAEKT
jgi:hypothetical protein